ncbi:hypothetical protein BDP81DRAFT_413061 [Colletotrichum phormii]|uniref:Uncharacterized protein n=1 Tax=Colletotrichum phormii TaxID=359342 RepID=A0AAJ0A375_9PEZI|nr:uncharacterized protein BDP81DRAFT_413061 [Colletotrichum phormii]KAK1655633.1 hypothetical protein BDP81DRAFT_413061 [Colletotrichum phormii]
MAAVSRAVDSTMCGQLPRCIHMDTLATAWCWSLLGVVLLVSELVGAAGFDDGVGVGAGAGACACACACAAVPRIEGLVGVWDAAAADADIAAVRLACAGVDVDVDVDVDAAAATADAGALG